jgi:hypothetical protein
MRTLLPEIGVKDAHQPLAPPVFRQFVAAMMN